MAKLLCRCFLLVFFVVAFISITYGKEGERTTRLPSSLKDVLDCGIEKQVIEKDALYLTGRLVRIYRISDFMPLRELSLWKKGPYQPVILEFRVLEPPQCKRIRYFLIKKGVLYKPLIGQFMEFLINHNSCSSNKRCFFILSVSLEE